MCDPTIAAMFGALVRRFGGVEASAALIEARMGACSKSTISKEISGQAMVSIEHVRALEDALGSYPITMMLFERVSESERRRAGDLRALAARTTVASAEAVAAVIKAFSDESPDPTRALPHERAEIITRMREARGLINDIIAAAEGVDE